MTKNDSKPKFLCSQCQHLHPRWVGQCVQCAAWNTVVASSGATAGGYTGARTPSQPLSGVSVADQGRIHTGIGELDRTLGGGLVPGSAVLIWGDPGAGKSTLLLQVLCNVARQRRVLYVTGEENLARVARRARRLGLDTERVNCMAESNVETILNTWGAEKPSLCVIDSIQAMQTDSSESSAGSATQVRESAQMLLRQAKGDNTVLILIGHITKDGHLAGPKVLEHMIDASLMFDSERDYRYRTLRSIKNRFGSVNELGIFAMTATGLKEVQNPSAIFLSGNRKDAPGSVVMPVWEGSRALLVEAQALVDDSAMNNPRRIAVGFESNRLAMLLAIMHSHGGIELTNRDVFVNAVGGVRVDETSSDMALLLAIASSFLQIALPRSLACFGEAGLSGEIRPVPNGQERLNVAAKQGFTHVILPKANRPKTSLAGIKVSAVESLQDVLRILRGLAPANTKLSTVATKRSKVT